jgi:hypothetical protein
MFLVQKFVLCVLASIDTATPLSGQSNAFLPRRDNTTLPCADVSASINAQAPVTTPTVPAKLAYECITSVPLNISAALAFTKAIRPCFLWQSTTAYLKNPPAEYVEKIQNLVDAWGGLDAIEKNLTSGVWTQEYEVRKSYFQ